jgi:hypothetical protein
LLVYFTVSTALSLMNPAVVAVIVGLPMARAVARPPSLIVAFERSLLCHATPGVPITLTGQRIGQLVLRRLPTWPQELYPQHRIAPSESSAQVCQDPAASLTGALIPLTRTGVFDPVVEPLPSSPTEFDPQQ